MVLLFQDAKHPRCVGDLEVLLRSMSFTLFFSRQIMMIAFHPSRQLFHIRPVQLDQKQRVKLRPNMTPNLSLEIHPSIFFTKVQFLSFKDPTQCWKITQKVWNYSTKNVRNGVTIEIWVVSGKMAFKSEKSSKRRKTRVTEVNFRFIKNSNYI